MDFSHLIETAGAALRGPLTYWLEANQRVFWIFLLGALALSLVALALQGRLHKRGILGLFSPKVWLHRSSVLDYQLVFAKPVIHALLFAPFLFSAYSLSLWVVNLLDGRFGRPEPSGLSPWVIRALYTVTLFICWDASRYVIHRLAHVVPFLWELHKVHHSAEVMTPFTIYRSHPLESLLFKVRGAFVTGIVTGIFFHLFRSEAIQYEFLGVNAVGFVLNTLGGNLRHSHVWLRYPRWLEKIFISPAQHQIHHSTSPEECHSNYGSWLAIWDRLGGSFLHSGERRPARFGLPPGDRNHSNGLISSLVHPLVSSVSRLLPRRRAVSGGVSRT